MKTSNNMEDTMKYHKIQGPFKRHAEGPDRGKIIFGEWSCDEFAFLHDNDWVWTNKIDGTNVRIMWDGYTVSFGGRTENAQLHADLLAYLHATYTEELMEQVFGDKAVTVFGEGVGKKIQGGLYGDEYRVIVFDIYFHGSGIFLKYEDLIDVCCEQLGVPIVEFMGFYDPIQAAEMVLEIDTQEDHGRPHFEGFVGTPVCDLRARNGDRIIMKVKARDVREYADKL